jgi:hypothetical protein
MVITAWSVLVPGPFKKYRLCQPNVFSGIFTLFGAQAKRTVYQYHYAVVGACYNINVKEESQPILPRSQYCKEQLWDWVHRYSQTVSHKAVRYKTVLSIP